MATTTQTRSDTVTLSNDEILRYSRHLIMPEVGMEGQLKIKAAKVLCIGAGGLGSPLALYLGAAGIGTLGIVDFDVVANRRARSTQTLDVLRLLRSGELSEIQKIIEENLDMLLEKWDEHFSH